MNLAPYFFMMRYFLTFIFFSFLLAQNASGSDMLHKCSTLSRMIELEEGLPPLLLSAVTFVESSDMPWVIGVKGVSHRYSSKHEALAKIKELKNKGYKNFDIGCMQINHFFHNNKFQSEEDMLNPIRNIRYAAKFLKQLKFETGSWDKAIAYYNSRDLRYSTSYTNKIYDHWNKIKSNSNLPIEQSSLPSMLKDNPRTKWYTSNIVNNNTLQRAKLAYLTYKKTLIRQ